MVEAFGAAAAAVQFAGLCTGAIIATDSLYRRLKHAPTRIRRRWASV